MKKIANKNFIKKMLIIVLVILFCNVLMPAVYAMGPILVPVISPQITEEFKEKSKTKDLFTPITSFFCAVGDITMSILQENIVGTKALVSSATNFSLKYSPGIIFSGTLPAFDINFISPMENQEKYIIKEPEKIEKIITTATTAFYNDSGDIVVLYKNNELFQNILQDMDGLHKEMKDIIANKKNITEELKTYKEGEHLANKNDVLSYIYSLQEEYGYYEETSSQQYQREKNIIEEEPEVHSWWFNEEATKISGYTNQYIIYTAHKVYYDEDSITQIYQVKMTKTVLEKQSTLESIARIMRKTIASWYKAMQEIALVGLLSVLVYIAIRGIISSSTTDKAKYKKMLLDWLVAVVIVLIMHYIISFTLAITSSISDVFNVNIIDESGNDIIFSKLRSDIAAAGDLGAAFIKVVMYYSLIILTIKYTIVYFKRVIYVAFLTMIGPIVGLTYPLDKIKDGQAQAFSFWIKEFLFNALIQPFHLVLYYAFVGSSIMSSYSQKNPIFAVVVLAFMAPAEKLLKKMFGFDKGGKLGSLEAAFGGATVMNMINKMGSKKSSSNNGGGNNEGGNNQENAKVRMVDNVVDNPYEALTRVNQETSGENEGVQTGVEQQRIAQTNTTQPEVTQTSVAQRRQTRENVERNRMVQEKEEQQRRALESVKQKENDKEKIKQKRKTNKSSLRTSLSNIKDKTLEIYNKPTITGARAVGGKVFKSVAKGTLKGALRLGGVATLGTIGFAAGIATGDFDKAIGGAIGGITAGNAVGKNVYNTGSRIERGINRFGDDLTYTFEEGKYGTQTAESRRKAREFRKTKTYIQLLERFPESKDKIEKLVRAGIYDASKIRKVIKNSEKYSVDNGIAYIHMANLCPDDIFEDRDKFKEYLANHGISEDKAEEIYRAVKEYK